MENLERNCFHRIMFIDLLAFELGKLFPGVGIFYSFFRPGGQSSALKSCPGGGGFDQKISGLVVSPGGDGNRSN